MNSEVNKLVLYALILLATTFAAPSKKIIHMKACRKSNPQFQQCFKTELQNVIPLLNDGYPKYRLQPLDPFDLQSLDIAKGQGAVAVDLSLKNLKIYGLTSAQIQTLKIDPENLEGYIKVTFNKPINLIGQYIAKGKVQVLPINGKGFCNITMIDPTIEIFDISGEPYEKDGKTYIKIKNFNLKATRMNKLILRLDNLFQGNKELSDNLNIFLNENWQLLFEELRPAFEEAVSVIVKDIAQKVLLKVPRNDIFPE